MKKGVHELDFLNLRICGNGGLRFDLQILTSG
jgi:hypothetical protein